MRVHDFQGRRMAGHQEDEAVLRSRVQKERRVKDTGYSLFLPNTSVRMTAVTAASGITEAGGRGFGTGMKSHCSEASETVHHQPTQSRDRRLSRTEPLPPRGKQEKVLPLGSRRPKKSPGVLSPSS